VEIHGLLLYGLVVDDIGKTGREDRDQRAQDGKMDYKSMDLLAAIPCDDDGTFLVVHGVTA